MQSHSFPRASVFLCALIGVLSAVDPAQASLPQTTFYVTDQIDTQSVYKVTSSGQQTLFAGGLKDPGAMAMDAMGNLYVACVGDNTVRKFTPSGSMSTFASGLNYPTGLVFDHSGNLLILNANAGGSIVSVTPGDQQSTWLSGVGGQAMTIDGSGNLYVVYPQSITQCPVEKITPSKQISPFASNVGDSVSDLLFDGSGNLYACSYGSNFITKTTPLGNTSPFYTGSPLDGPSGMAFDSAGNLFVTNYGGTDAIDAIPPSGSAQTVLSFSNARLAPFQILVAPEPASTVTASLIIVAMCKRTRRKSAN